MTAGIEDRALWLPCSLLWSSWQEPRWNGTASSIIRAWTIRTNLFGTTYYSLIGLHVTVEMLMILIVMLLTLGKHVTRRHAEQDELLSWY